MSAIIPVNNQYRIELDTRSWQISRWQSQLPMSERGDWQGFSWHSTLQSAADCLVERLLADDQQWGVEEILVALNEASRTVAAAIRASGLPDPVPVAGCQDGD